jgi:hypothetical protein
MKIGVNLINFGPGAEPAALGRWARGSRTSAITSS